MATVSQPMPVWQCYGSGHGVIYDIARKMARRSLRCNRAAQGEGVNAHGRSQSTRFPGHTREVCERS